jgi:hypothetical protein
MRWFLLTTCLLLCPALATAEAAPDSLLSVLGEQLRAGELDAALATARQAADRPAQPLGLWVQPGRPGSPARRPRARAAGLREGRGAGLR